MLTVMLHVGHAYQRSGPNKRSLGRASCILGILLSLFCIAGCWKKVPRLICQDMILSKKKKGGECVPGWCVHFGRLER